MNVCRFEKAVLKNVSTNRDYYDEERYYHTLSFGGEDYYYASAKIDALTGKVLNFYQDTEYDDLTEEDKKKTDEKINYYLNLLCPGETGEGLEFRLNEKRGRIGFKYFTRYINNIPYDDDGIRIEVSKDGYLAGYNYVRTDIEFPNPEGIISEDKAAEITKELLSDYSPLDIINNEIIPALNTVGKGFEEKTVYLPQLFQELI